MTYVILGAGMLVSVRFDRNGVTTRYTDYGEEARQFRSYGEALTLASAMYWSGHEHVEVMTLGDGVKAMVQRRARRPAPPPREPENVAPLAQAREAAAAVVEALDGGKPGEGTLP